MTRIHNFALLAAHSVSAASPASDHAVSTTTAGRSTYTVERSATTEARSLEATPYHEDEEYYNEHDEYIVDEEEEYSDEDDAEPFDEEEFTAALATLEAIEADVANFEDISTAQGAEDHPSNNGRVLSESESSESASNPEIIHRVPGFNQIPTPLTLTNEENTADWCLAKRHTFTENHLNLSQHELRYEGKAWKDGQWNDLTWYQGYIPHESHDMYHEKYHGINVYACNERIVINDEGEKRTVWDTNCCAYKEKNDFWGSCIQGFSTTVGEKGCGYEFLDPKSSVYSTICELKPENDEMNKVLNEIQEELEDLSCQTNIHSLIVVMATMKDHLKSLTKVNKRQGDSDETKNPEASQNLVNENAALKHSLDGTLAELKSQLRKLRKRSIWKNLSDKLESTTSLLPDVIADLVDKWEVFRGRLDLILNGMDEDGKNITLEQKWKEAITAIKIARKQAIKLGLVVEEQLRSYQTPAEQLEECQSVVEEEREKAVKKEEECEKRIDLVVVKYTTDMESMQSEVEDAYNELNDYKFKDARDSLTDILKDEDEVVETPVVETSVDETTSVETAVVATTTKGAATNDGAPAAPKTRSLRGGK